MCKHFSIILLFVFITINVFNGVMCYENPGRILACHPEKLKYEEFKIEFLFSSINKSNQVFNKRESLGLDGIDFDPRRRTTVVVHGHGGNARDSIMQGLRNELLDWSDVNVILVNWEQGSSNPLLYHQAAINTEYVAMKIQRLFSYFKKILSNTHKSIDNWGPLHFVGFSLGAHVVGQAANLLQKKDNITVDRITGLDPAEPCFETVNPLRLKSSDARFVDVIHTDGSTSVNERFGLLEPIGHVDFYVNGGSIQPGCNNRSRRKRYLDYFKLLQHSLANGSCHHIRAFLIFIESLRQIKWKKCKFWAYPWTLGKKPPSTQGMKCDFKSCIEMGINAELNNFTKQVYYVPTTANRPYCNVK